MSTEDVLEQYRREVTPEDAGLAMLAVERYRNKGYQIPSKHLETLMALAVEKHAPKREEARNAER